MSENTQITPFYICMPRLLIQVIVVAYKCNSYLPCMFMRTYHSFYFLILGLFEPCNGLLMLLSQVSNGIPIQKPNHLYWIICYNNYDGVHALNIVAVCVTKILPMYVSQSINFMFFIFLPDVLFLYLSWDNISLFLFHHPQLIHTLSRYQLIFLLQSIIVQECNETNRTTSQIWTTDNIQMVTQSTLIPFWQTNLQWGLHASWKITRDSYTLASNCWDKTTNILCLKKVIY